MANSARMQSGGSGGGGVYGLGLIGAAVYYWRHADDGAASKAKAVGKALVWPAFVVYDVLEHMSGGTEPEESAGSLEGSPGTVET
jgi:hypothetical protein